MTLRGRLIVAAVVIGLTVMGALGVVAVRQRNVLTAQLDDQLRVVRSNFNRSDRIIPPDGLAVPLSDGFFATGEMYFAVIGADGTEQVVAFPASHPDLVPDVATLDFAEQSLSDEPLTVEVDGADGKARLLIVDVGEGRWAVIALSTEAIDSAQGQMLVTAAIALTVIVAAMAVMLWSVDRLGIRPIAAVTQAAEDIAAGRSDRRVAPIAESTEAGRLGAAFNTMLDARAISEARQRRFVADASHELRTPLTTLLGYTSLHATGGHTTQEQTDDAMARIASEAKRMRALVEDLLSLASLDDGRPLDRGTVDLSQLIADIAADARAVQPERPIDCARVVGNVTICADRHQLTQALTTIVTNALRYTPKNAQLSFTLDESHHRVRIGITDQGPGISPEHLDHLFERFYRADPGRARTAGGSGLGLSIAQAIADAHGGHIEAESTEGVGTTLTVDLPINQLPHR